jgi:ribosomal protein S18 acetylase RimI-like enzyme
MNISLRPVADADLPLLFQLYASTREMELAQVPWGTEQKQAFLEMQFAAQLHAYAASHPQAAHDMICVDGEPLGRLYLDRSEDFHILDITVAPACRNQGIGGEILRRIIAEAEFAGKTVSIYTETFNPSMRLFERVGFRQKSVDGFLVLLEKPTLAPHVPPAD